MKIGGFVLGHTHLGAHGLGLHVKIREHANDVVAKEPIRLGMGTRQQVGRAPDLRGAHADDPRGGVAHDGHAGQPIQGTPFRQGGEPLEGIHGAADSRDACRSRVATATAPEALAA